VLPADIKKLRVFFFYPTHTHTVRTAFDRLGFIFQDHTQGAFLSHADKNNQRDLSMESMRRFDINSEMCATTASPTEIFT